MNIQIEKKAGYMLVMVQEKRLDIISIPILKEELFYLVHNHGNKKSFCSGYQ